MVKAWVLKADLEATVETTDLSWRGGKRERNSGTTFSCPFEVIKRGIN